MNESSKFLKPIAGEACVILHLPTIINHCDNSNVQQKEERLVSSTHLLYLQKG